MGQPRTDIEKPNTKPAEVFVYPQTDAAKQARPVDAPELDVDDGEDEGIENNQPDA